MATRGRLIALEGPSGVGKSTVARLLGDRRGWSAIAEAFVRLGPTVSLDVRSVGELVRLEELLLDEEGRRYREATRRCRHGERVVADTGFLGPLTYTAGLVALGRSPPSALRQVRRSVDGRIRDGTLGWPDGILYLDLPSEELRERSSTDLLGHPEPLAARHRAVGRFERRFYLETLSKRWPTRVVRVPSAAAPETVARRAVALARAIPRSAPSKEEADEAVALLVASAERRVVRAPRRPATLKKGPRSHGALRR